MSKEPDIEDVARVVCAISGKPSLSPEFVQVLANERGRPIDYQDRTYAPIRVEARHKPPLLHRW